MRRKNKGMLPSVLGVDGYNPAAGGDESVVAQKSGAAAAPTAAAAVVKTSADDAAAVPAKRPSADAASGAAKITTATKKPASAAAAAPVTDPKQRIDSAIGTLMKYRTGGDGGNALKLLLTFCKNIDSNPTETKFRSVNPESGPFKAKLAPLVGPVSLLKAVGFEKSEEDGKLKFQGPAPNEVLSYAVAQLTAAESLYRQQNS